MRAGGDAVFFIDSEYATAYEVVMLVGCYTIDLYCDNADKPATEKTCDVGWGYNGPPQFTGETEGECIRAARAIGWLITRDRPRKTYCPECAKKRRTK